VPKLLLVGGGGREHALAWKLTRDDPALEIVAAPGNPGIARHARCANVRADDVDGLLALAEQERAAVTLVGPEAPLAAGIVDRFTERGLAIFGPTAAAAEIETSKRFAKQLMLDAGVPTAEAEFHTDPDEAKRALRRLGAPIVVKASGLAAGKGVVVCATVEEAERAVDMMLREGAFGAAGAEILLERFMEGEELSLFAITDGTVALPLLPAQDHKRLLDGDRGPNTGGMGAYAPVSLGTPALVDEVRRTILEPTLAALRDAGRPFRGLLYAGLMLTPEGPTVVAAPGYPESAATGAPLVPPTEAEDLLVFHAGTRRADGGLVSAGGRVLAVTGLGPTLADAARRSREAAAATALDGRRMRTDIGWRDLARAPGSAGAS